MCNFRRESTNWFLFYLLFAGCIEPYPPPISDTEVGFLVVDGYLDNIEGSASVTISRATPLVSAEASPRELGAIVRVEDNEGNYYILEEVELGTYSRPNLPVMNTREYRLYIRTSDEREFISDFISPRPVPEIDSVTWAVSDDRSGIEIFVTTHDDNDQTKFYQWNFEETFQYQSAFIENYEITGGEVVVVPGGVPTYDCWKTVPSQKIIVSSSEGLSRDVIYKQPVTSLPKGTQKLFVRYSILVKQKSLSREAYDYWVSLRQTTESLGGLYDPQPGQVTGNLSEINRPGSVVLGYFDVISSTENRIFIDYIDLPADLRFKPQASDCALDTVLIKDIPDFDSSNYSLLTELYQGPALIGYLYTKKICTDCRLQNGVTTKPDFWE